MCGIILIGSSAVIAQPRFILKRTNKESTPVFVQILGGYNGVSDPAEAIQIRVRDIDGNTYGGVMMGIQVAMTLDSMFRQPLWFGTEVYYHRFVDRDLSAQSDVFYPDEPELPVKYIEVLHSVGAQLFFAYNIVRRFQLQLGGGVQYMYTQVSIPTDVSGLFEPQVIPTASVMGRFILLEYDHGSIDVNIRGMQGFGEYGSFEVQSLLGFTFRF
jgi:hypothetical protein